MINKTEKAYFKIIKLLVFLFMNFSFIITSDRFHLGTEKTTCNTDMNVKMENSSGKALGLF